MDLRQGPPPRLLGLLKVISPFARDTGVVRIGLGAVSV